ncbi:MAG TPA: ubiquinol-cytochrome c reductase cytochrome b subunit [Streptosporangiaceae bacterium]|jgi:ubiquinol-cytochrome c reductase cytochrome b subunit|nr:ubiquinol-cytochrome c reductase cytochrome b subunit [Streptosporangiaceae bacterium]
MTKSKTTEALETTGVFLDDRLRAAKATTAFLRKLYPDHWSFLLGEIALYSFIILLLTGTFLTFFFQPSMTEVIYHGTYTPLRGVRMSDAYASTLNISFDVRGGLLMRQIHHWAALLFLAAIMVHMLRIFFTGAYRKPREFNWLIGIVLFTLGLFEGLFGYSLPDDLLSGTGLKITQGVLQSIPIVGTYGSYFLFGGEFPGHLIIPRLYVIHILLIPALLLALISAHLFFMFHQKHTQMPSKGRTNANVVGAPTYPYFAAKTGAFFFFIFAVLALLSTFAQINPIWLFGPYNPSGITAGSQPDFYMGALEGALRIMPAWEWNVFGHTLAFNVFIPALVPLGIIFTGAALWPFLEQWATGDRREHHVNDRPRNAPTRTGVGMAAVTFWGVLWLEGANDIIADQLQIPLFTLTWIARFAVILGPIIAYWVTKRICLGLQRKDAHLLEHGVETGIVRQLPTGAYVEETRPVSEDLRAVLEYNQVGRPQLTAPRAGEDADEVPALDARTPMGRVRTRINRVLTEGIPVEADGHGDGHGDGHAAPAAVTAGEQGADRPDRPEREQGGTDGEDTSH